MIDGKQVTRRSSYKETENERLNSIIRTEYECFVSCIRKKKHKYDYRWLGLYGVHEDFITAFIDVEIQHKKILALLTDRQREVYILHYIHGREQTEIAKELKISKQGVNKNLQLIDKKIYQVITVDVLRNRDLELELQKL
ncbi:sigma factor-like helix-turn-helix DNA-binding protein [Clostridium sp.]|uniref:sigma factor-like helix-turn-helix DNA-binding protein n=1 Tax=Clostridium sp. TaxID=1506 RepID=UPI00352099D4